MEINEKIKNLIDENDVCLFMKGNARFSSVWFFNGSFKCSKTFKCRF
jgi:glutaredoxin-related protein